MLLPNGQVVSIPSLMLMCKTCCASTGIALLASGPYPELLLLNPALDCGLV